MSEKKKKTLQQVYGAPTPVNEEFAGAPADMSQAMFGPWPQRPVRGVDVQMGAPQILPPVQSVQVQMGEPRVVPPILPPPPEDPLDARAAALERGVRSGGYAMLPALQQMGPASGPQRLGTADDVSVDTEELARMRQAARQERELADPMYWTKARMKLQDKPPDLVKTAAQKQYEFYKQAGLPENEALNRARADALLLQNHLSRSEED